MTLRRWLQRALDELKRFQEDRHGSSGEPSRLLLPDISSAATSERHDSAVVPYHQRLQQLEGALQQRGLAASQINTACATPNVGAPGGNIDDDDAIDQQVRSLWSRIVLVGCGASSYVVVKHHGTL